MKQEDFTLTPEETRLARRRRRILVIGACALLLMIFAVVFGGGPAANAIRGWQARRHAQKAFDLINKEQWNDAQMEAVGAYQLQPLEPQAARAVARFLSRTNKVEALGFWKQLEDSHALTIEDRRDEALIAIIASDAERAEAAVRELIGSKDAGPADWLLAAQLAIQKKIPDDAQPYLEKVISDPRANEAQQLQASSLQLAIARDESQRAKATARIEKISSGKSATALEALVVLVKTALSVPMQNGGTGYAESGKSAASTIPESADAITQEVSPNLPPIVSKNEIVDLAHALENHPLAKAHHKMLALDLLLYADPTQHNAIVARAVKNWKDADPPDLASLGAWLNSKGEFEKTLNTIQLSRAIQGRDLFLQYLDALAGLGRWGEVKELLTSEKFPLDPVMGRMYLARCSGQLGEQTAAKNNWQRAFEAAAGDVRKLMMLADYAEKNGNAEIAGAAYDGAAAAAPKLRIAQNGRLRLAQASHDTKKLHAVLAEMLTLWPGDPAIQNDEAYSRLLLLPAESEETKRECMAIEQLADKLIEREPASLPHRTLLALARLRQGRPDGALTVYSDLRVAPDALSGSALTVHAAILAATAHTEDAKTEVAQIKREQLLPEEQTLIKGLLDQR